MHSLQHLHTFSLPSVCNRILTANSTDSLITLLKEQSTLYQTEMSYLVLGEGSNTVFVEDYAASVIVNKIMGIAHTQDQQTHYLSVGAGENWHQLVKYCMAHNIGGFENLALIPGTVGACPIQNIGAYGVEVERFISSVDFIDTTSMTLQNIAKEQCEFAYRDSIFKRQKLNQRIITQVNFALPKHYELVTSYGPLSSLESPNARLIFDSVIDIRQQKLPDPVELGNAGSFFKNPVVTMAHFTRLQRTYPNIPHFFMGSNTGADNAVKIPAAWLIDQLGFKGTTQGNIGCHVNQPLVLVNLGSGKGSDLLALARKIRDKVVQSFDIELENEVRLIGKNGLITL